MRDLPGNYIIKTLMSNPDITLTNAVKEYDYATSPDRINDGTVKVAVLAYNDTEGSNYRKFMFAIKAVRLNTDCGLAEAKRLVESIGLAGK